MGKEECRVLAIRPVEMRAQLGVLGEVSLKMPRLNPRYSPLGDRSHVKGRNASYAMKYVIWRKKDLQSIKQGLVGSKPHSPSALNEVSIIHAPLQSADMSHQCSAIDMLF